MPEIDPKRHKSAKEELLTALEHMKETDHLETVEHGTPATELQERVRVDRGGWISGPSAPHPAGSKLEQWDREARAGTQTQFERELGELINRHSIDAQIGMPDFVLAHFLVNQLANLAGVNYSNRKQSSDD